MCKVVVFVDFAVYSVSHTCRFTAIFPVTPELAGALAKIRLTGTTSGFYEPDVLPATQHIMSKHYRKTQWFGCLLTY